MEHKLIVNGVQVPLTAEEIAQRQADELAWNAGAFDRAMKALRSKRNSLLAATDYTQLPDVGFNAAERNAYMIYRQALRDITNNIETAEQAKSIVFPSKP
jgi:alkyl sulfatase BDS1-like metallo-beta-lactamase superfamily hydrolase